MKFRHGTYMSKQFHSLQDKTALLRMDEPCEGKVLAQFDDVATGKGHGWFEFHAEEFKLDEKDGGHDC